MLEYIGNNLAEYYFEQTIDGQTIAVSDSGNNRIQQFSAASGAFIASFGSQGNAVGQFNTPKGLTYDALGILYIVDSGNNRIALGQDSVTGTYGAALGQFIAPVNISVGERGVFVADTGNNRIQSFNPSVPNNPLSVTPSTVRFAVSTNLNQPSAVAAVNDLMNDKFYVADSGNNRVILCSVPGDSPDTLQAVWNSMTNSIGNGDISGAISSFCSDSAEGYRQAFLCVGTADLISDINQIGTLTPVFIKNDTAEYYFEQTIDGHLLLFPVKFVKENGVWKILEF